MLSRKTGVVIGLVGCLLMVALLAEPVRVPFLVASTMVLPGWLLVTATPGGRFGTAEALALALGLSITVVMTAGLAIGLLGLPIQAAAWWVLLAVTAALTAAVLVARRRSGVAVVRLPAISSVDVALLVAGLVFAASALSVSFVGARDARTAGYESVPELWILPVGDRADAVTVGVGNLGSASGRYVLELRVDGAVTRRLQVVLGPDSDWTRTFRLPRQADRVDAVLYARRSGVPIRHVWQAAPA